MKKVAILILICTVSAISVSAQGTLMVEYKNFAFGDVYIDRLLISDTISTMETIDYVVRRGMMFSSSDGRGEDYFIKDKVRNLLYLAEEYYKYFDVVDTLHPMKWTLTKETKEILGYKCKSATTTFRGRSYTAFYAPKIPVSDGPWKFGGLPGLILEVNSNDDEVRFVATKLVRESKEKIKTIDLSKIKFITIDQFFNEFISICDKHAALIKAQLPPGMTTELKVSSIEIIYPAFNLGKGYVIKN
jgi:GLPGLI family protein